MDGVARSVIHRHRPAQRNQKIPLQRHFSARADTARHGLEATHNPKVVGSNSTPATNKSPGQSTRSDLGFVVLWTATQLPSHHYLHFTEERGHPEPIFE